MLCFRWATQFIGRDAPYAGPALLQVMLLQRSCQKELLLYIEAVFLSLKAGLIKV